eukprot:896492-Prorocentrum_minimum.AAC.1
MLPHLDVRACAVTLQTEGGNEGVGRGSGGGQEGVTRGSRGGHAKECALVGQKLHCFCELLESRVFFFYYFFYVPP